MFDSLTAITDIEALTSPHNNVGTPQIKALSIESSWSELLSELRDIEAEIKQIKETPVCLDPSGLM